MGSKRRNDIIFRDLESTRILDLLNKKATDTFENLILHSNMAEKSLSTREMNTEHMPDHETTGLW